MSVIRDRLLDDHEGFCRQSLRIRDKQGNIVPFLLQPAQQKLHTAIAKQRAAGQPVRIIYLKPRRVMVSAGTAAEFFHIIPFTAGQHGLVVAHEKKAAKEIWNYHRDFHNLYQPYEDVLALPALARQPGQQAVIEYLNGSYITIETANNLDAGRAFSIRYLHLSEYAYYRNARRLCTGLLQSVPDDPDTMVIKESTANGAGNPFHQDWLLATDPAHASGWLAVFFAWFEHPEYVLPLGGRRGEFQAALSREEIDLMRRHSLSLEQMAWRRWAIATKCDNSPENFQQEYPATPEEAFLYSGRPRFNHKHITRQPVVDGAPAGELVEQIGPQRLLRFEARDKGPLTIYKRPVPGRRYVAGIDVAEGIDVGDGTVGGQDPDWSVMQVCDADTGEQVAKLRGRIEPDPFAEYSAAVARWYNYAFLIPEKNGVGLAFIEGLLRHQYPPALIYHTQPEVDKQFTAQRATSLQELGWRQTEVSRVQLLAKLDAALREGTIILHDPNTISECFTFIVRPGGRAEHQDGCHDDEVFACALAVEGLLHPPPDKRLQPLNPALDRQRSGIGAGVQTYGAPLPQRGRLIRVVV